MWLELVFHPLMDFIPPFGEKFSPSAFGVVECDGSGLGSIHCGLPACGAPMFPIEGVFSGCFSDGDLLLSPCKVSPRWWRLGV